MTIVFGQLGTGNLTFGQLDQSLTEAFEQTGDSELELSDSSTQEFVPVYEHGLYAEFEIYDASTQEFVDPAGAASYLQTTKALIALFDAGSHEYVPVVVVHEHSQPASVSLSGGGTHVYFPGADPGDYIHDGTVTTSWSASGMHSYTPSMFVVTRQALVPLLAPWLSDEPTETPLDFSDDVSSVNTIRFEFESSDPAWLTGAGPTGGQVSAAVEMVQANGGALPIVSLSEQWPHVSIQSALGATEMFNAIRDAILAGPVSFRLGGYEALSDRSLPYAFEDTSTLKVSVVT